MNLSAATAEIVPQTQLDPLQIQRLRSLSSIELLSELLRTYREQAAKQIMEIQWQAQHQALLPELDSFLVS